MYILNDYLQLSNKYKGEYLPNAVKVYFSNAKYIRGIGGPSQKLAKLLDKSGFTDKIKSGDVVAVKMHFGEPGNVRYIRPIFPVLLVDFIKQCGGKPFVTDSTVLYKSERNNYFGYLEVARRNGFTNEVLGCPLLISGGLKDHGVTVEVDKPLVLPKVSISREIWDADVLISLAHATMHLEFPYACSLKNIGMGCVDRYTKEKMHNARKLSPSRLNAQAANIDGASVVIKHFTDKILACNIALDVTPECDCFDKTDLPIIPDLGIFLSQDVVACDQATFMAIIDAPGYPGSLLEGHEGMQRGGNKVSACHAKQSGWAEHDKFLRQAGIGSMEYEVVEV